MELSALSIFTMVGIFMTVSPVHASVPSATDQIIPYMDLFENHETQVLHVTSDAMSGAVDLKLFLDSNSNILSLRQYSDNGSMKEFSLSQLAAGAVLLNSSGHDVITLTSQGLDVHSGGVINMTYLTNGITNSYDTFSMEVIPGTQWTIQVNDQAGRHAISTMFLKGNTFFGKVIGIADVEVN